MHCLTCFGLPLTYVHWVRECIKNSRFSIAVNGTLVGYFEGAKGLRQGDPLSSYLFVVAMEVFTWIMNEVAKNRILFNFHPRCSKLQITHLSFADDLLVFAAANMKSLQYVKDVLQVFAYVSGLHAKPSKSSFFCAGVSTAEKERLLDCWQIKEAHLPVRYVGAPLISSKLSAADCGVLVDLI